MTPLAIEVVRRLVASAAELVKARRARSPGGKRITRNERRAIVRALLPEVGLLVAALDADEG
jgi:hypothetical protein